MFVVWLVWQAGKKLAAFLILNFELVNFTIPVTVENWDINLRLCFEARVARSVHYTQHFKSQLQEQARDCKSQPVTRDNASFNFDNFPEEFKGSDV